jgi:hypothetical protein
MEMFAKSVGSKPETTRGRRVMLLGFESQICVQNAPNNKIPHLKQCQIAKYHKQDRSDALPNRNTKPNRNGANQQHRWRENKYPKA